MKAYSCPICKHEDWCWPHHATGHPCCRRIGEPHQLHYDRNGVPYFVHGDVAPIRVTRPQSMPLAPDDLRSSVYKTIWWLLGDNKLNDRHAQQLQDRGIPQTIARGLASWPDPEKRPGIIRYLAANFDHEALLGVPGIYSERGSKLLKLGGLPGLAIPVEDLQGRWLAVRLRPDDPSRGKYQWLTSAGPARGDGPGPPHVPYLAAKPGYFRAGHVRTPHVLITEGEPAQGAAAHHHPARPAGHQPPRRRVLEARRPHPGGRRGRAGAAGLGPRLAHQPSGGARPERLFRPPESARSLRFDSRMVTFPKDRR